MHQHKMLYDSTFLLINLFTGVNSTRQGLKPCCELMLGMILLHLPTTSTFSPLHADQQGRLIISEGQWYSLAIIAGLLIPKSCWSCLLLARRESGRLRRTMSPFNPHPLAAALPQLTSHLQEWTRNSYFRANCNNTNTGLLAITTLHKVRSYCIMQFSDGFNKGYII